MTPHSEKSLERIQIGPKKKIAFVCSGGAAKAGAFHLGVALALQEQGFRFFGGLIPPAGERPTPQPMDISLYVGSSAGSIISTYLAAGYSLDNIISSFLGKKTAEMSPKDLLPKRLPRLTYQKMFRIRPNLGSEKFSQLMRVRKVFSDLIEGNWEALIQFKWLKATGLFSTHGIEQYIREEVLYSNQFQDYLADLFIVSTQLNLSRKVVFGKRSCEPPPHDPNCLYLTDIGISDACAASTALPIIFSPHKIKDKNDHSIYYIDGEIRETLSTHVAVDAGADLIIASYTHQPFHAAELGASLTSHGVSAIVMQSIYLLIEQKIKNHVHNKKIQRNAINSVYDYCTAQGISPEHRAQICEILEKELHHRLNVDTIYIHPNAMDSQLFFSDHFSLSPRRMMQVVQSGFRATIEILKKYDFADRKIHPAIGTAGTP